MFFVRLFASLSFAASLIAGVEVAQSDLATGFKE